jgi:hypothetical protein
MPTIGIPRGAAIAIDDLLDNCARVKAGDEVVLLAHIDGLYGGDNLVDPQVIAWLQAAIQRRDANASILWIDEVPKMHAWRVPPVFMAALKACDVFINHSFDLTIEEQKIIQETATEFNTTLVRNFATTPELLNSVWAQTPHKLISEIRYQSCKVFEAGLPYEITDDNGTSLEGTIAPPNHPRFPTYMRRRWDGPGYHPFPEWIFPPINISDTSGTLVFDRMLSWWSRYIGISPFFKDFIRLTIEKGRITRIEGGEEADALKRFLKSMEGRLGDAVYGFPEAHAGVHPNPEVGPHQLSNPLHRRIVEHSGTNCIHMHIGAPWPNEKYPYWLHITADILNATWRVGDKPVLDRGYQTALDDPAVQEVAAKNPDRPGLSPWPKSF